MPSDTFLSLSATAWTAIYDFLTLGLLIVAVVAAIYAKRQWTGTRDKIEQERRDKWDDTLRELFRSDSPDNALAALVRVLAIRIESADSTNYEKQTLEAYLTEFLKDAAAREDRAVRTKHGAPDDRPRRPWWRRVQIHNLRPTASRLARRITSRLRASRPL